MATNRNRLSRLYRRYLAGAPGVCALLAFAAFAAGPLHSGAQSAPPQQTPTIPQQDPNTPAPQQDSNAPAVQQDQNAAALQSSSAPAQPAAVETSAPQAPTENQAAPSTAAKPPRPPYPGLTPEEKSKQQVAQECANLLQLATDLKTQVEKTRKDELSLVVVRKATELEQMAHKVRNETPLTAENR